MTEEVPRHLPTKQDPSKLCVRELNPAFIALWESYLDEGMSAKHVGEIFGVAKTTVLRHYPGRGWDAKTKLQYSMDVKALNRV